MSVADAGIKWVTAVIAAPFVAILFAAIGKILHLVYQSTRINGNGRFAQAQESVHEDATLALDLLELASSIETWVLFIVFILAIYGAISQGGSSGRR